MARVSRLPRHESGLVVLGRSSDRTGLGGGLAGWRSFRGPGKRRRIGCGLAVLEVPGYAIGSLVGTGAGSTIYLGTHVVTKKRVAIKHVDRKTADDDRFIEQVELEYDISHQLHHPALRYSHSIHRVKKFLQVKEVAIVMDYVDGLPLETARPNKLETFLAICHRVAGGLHAMHEAGFVHSDIKPNNIMVAKGGVVKIIDFGQSCPMGHKKERIQGTPDYIAPEQVRRMPLDARTDVFNLGASMYWLLTSENYPTALRHENTRGGINLISADNPLAPHELNDRIPLALSKLVMECCRDNPNARPGDMQELSRRLEAITKLWKKSRSDARRSKADDAGEAAAPGKES